MDKEKQIKEMYQIFLNYKFSMPAENFSYKGMVENFIDNNYRKINENEVVISKEEYKRLKKQLKEMEEQRDEQAYITEDLIQEKHRWTEQATQRAQVRSNTRRARKQMLMRKSV